MNYYAHQDLVIKQAQAKRAGEARAIIDREQDTAATRARAYEWARQQFPDLVDANGHVCGWLVYAALEFKAAGNSITPDAVRQRRNRLIEIQDNRFEREDTPQ